MFNKIKNVMKSFIVFKLFFRDLSNVPRSSQNQPNNRTGLLLQPYVIKVLFCLCLSPFAEDFMLNRNIFWLIYVTKEFWCQFLDVNSK